VLAFLEAYADRFDLRRHVRCSTAVVRVDPIHPPQTSHHLDSGGDANGDEAAARPPPWGVRWRVATRAVGAGGQAAEEEVHEFDAVTVCVGHHSDPVVPQIPGLREWPGKQLHVHSFRGGHAFKGLTVVVVGASFSGAPLLLWRVLAATALLPQSHPQTPQRLTATHHESNQQHQNHTGEEIARHVADHAAFVYHSARSWPSNGPPAGRAATGAGGAPDAPFESRPNIERVRVVEALAADGGVRLAGGRELRGVDAVVWCTGYNYRFEFLEHLDLVQTGEPGAG
jgi:hypothetical protein